MHLEGMLKELSQLRHEKKLKALAESSCGGKCKQLMEIL